MTTCAPCTFRCWRTCGRRTPPSTTGWRSWAWTSLKPACPPPNRERWGWPLSWQRDCPVLTGTWEALADQGYIDRERVEWDDGLFLLLAEENPSGALTFTAQKWRSGTGAYWFTHCTARQNPSGHWDGYTVGGEAIS